MWHIDNNYHFSPFHDIRIAEITYRLSIDDLIKNCRNGILQRMVIQQMNPVFLNYISDKKNSGNIMSNFFKNFTKIQFPQDTTKTFR